MHEAGSGIEILRGHQRHGSLRRGESDIDPAKLIKSRHCPGQSATCCAFDRTRARGGPFLLDGDAVQAELAEFGPEVAREGVAAVDLVGARCNPVGGKAAHALAQHVGGFAEAEVEAADVVHAHLRRFRCANFPLPRHSGAPYLGAGLKFEYRIKGVEEVHERIARESELTKA
jgi:hypothetical protein